MFIKCECGEMVHVPPIKNIVCSECRNEVKIKTDNVVVWRNEEHRHLGIFWTFICKHWASPGLRLKYSFFVLGFFVTSRGSSLSLTA